MTDKHSPLPWKSCDEFSADIVDANGDWVGTLTDRERVIKAVNNHDKLQEISHKYHELLLAVGDIHYDETRHQTALRYINEAERGGGCASAELEGGKP